MSNMNHPEEFTLEAMLDEWGADEAPDDFATRMVQLAKGAPPSARSAWSRRSLVGPILLVAAFVSVGAAAAWGRYKPVRAPDTGAATPADSSTVERPARLSFHLAHDLGTAEVEKSTDAERESVLRYPALELPEAAAPSEREVPVEAAPRVVHWPKCECGTSGVVCTCSD